MPYGVKKARLDKLLEKKEQLKKAFVARETGRVLSFLPEEEKDGFSVGYSENYLRLYVKNRAGNGLIKVRVTGAYKDGAAAVPVENEKN